MYVGRPEDNGPLLRIRRGVLNKTAVAEQYEEFARAKQQLRLGETSSNVRSVVNCIKLGSFNDENIEAFDTDDEDESRSNDMAAAVNTTFAVPEILGKRRAAGEDRYPIKTRRSGEYRPIHPRVEEVVDESKTENQKSHHDDVEMTDVKKKEKTVRLINENPAPRPEKLGASLKKGIDTAAILRRVLNAKVEDIIVKDLLSASSALHQAFFSKSPVGIALELVKDDQLIKESPPVAAHVNIHRLEGPLSVPTAPEQTIYPWTFFGST